MKVYKLCVALALATTLGVMALAPRPASGGTNRFIYLNPSHGRVGDLVNFYGDGWDAVLSYNVTFAYGTPFAQGVFTGMISGAVVGGNFTVPGIPQGSYIVRVQGYIEYYDVPFRLEPRIVLGTTSDIVGGTVNVSGTGFSAGKAITIKLDGTSAGTATTNGNGSFSNTILSIPEASYGAHSIIASDANGNAAEASFSVNPSMVVAPVTGSGSDKLKVSGTGFAANATIIITLGPVEAAVGLSDAKGSFSISLSVPQIVSGTYDIRVSDETNVLSKAFTVAPKIASLTPASGYTGTKVAISGAGFKANLPISITFDNVVIATTNSTDDGRFTGDFVVPVLAGGTYTVTASDGTNNAKASFSISTTATISSGTSAASPGHVGDSVTVSGVGFIAGTTVIIKYDGSEMTTAEVLVDGKFSATFSVPASSHGEHTVTVTQGTSSVPIKFFMETAPPPAPKLLGPRSGASVKSRPTFDWTIVTDPSGVTYTLQIATANFTSSTDNSTTILMKSGLTQAEYTLIPAEKLEPADKDSVYYWRIKAVDGASNGSAWSETRAFTVGGFAFSLSLHPSSWLKYVLYVVGGVLILLLGVWIGRRTAYV